MSATLTIERALKNVDEAVERVLNDQDQRFPEAASLGDTVRQGDVYIQKIADVTATPVFYRKLDNPKFPYQLAPGNTKGSRHMLEHADGVTVYALNIKEVAPEQAEDFQAIRDSVATLEKEMAKFSRALTGETEDQARNWSSGSRRVSDEIANVLGFCGPIFNLTKETKISHPEHGDWILGPGSYRIVFQRTVDTDLQIRRVFD
jgi:hypothetical protein